jgi:GNAT superfamily N-acetyltransferase
VGSVQVSLRPFEDADYGRLVAVGSALDPGYPFTPDMLRHRDATLDPRVRSLRLVADVDGQGAIGFGRVMHMWWNFHPRRYVLRIEVEPAWQRRGMGSLLFERLFAELQAWQAEVVRSEARANRPAGVAFLERRGFVEWRRRWDSVLDVATADEAALRRRALSSDITITNYPAELLRRGERLARDLYDMETLAMRDEPGMDGHAESPSFERFRAIELDTPDALPEANFLALASEQLVGVSRVMRDLQHPDVLRQSLTGVHPDFRGRGIAHALKLRTLEFARAHGYREIRTSNDSSNGPMLHINDAVGFQRESPIIIFERRL